VHACCESGHSADGDGQSCDRDILTSKWPAHFATATLQYMNWSTNTEYSCSTHVSGWFFACTNDSFAVIVNLIPTLSPDLIRLPTFFGSLLSVRDDEILSTDLVCKDVSEDEMIICLIENCSHNPHYSMNHWQLLFGLISWHGLGIFSLVSIGDGVTSRTIWWSASKTRSTSEAWSIHWHNHWWLPTFMKILMTSALAAGMWVKTMDDKNYHVLEFATVCGNIIQTERGTMIW
jgi:hypothetical protein